MRSTPRLAGDSGSPVGKHHGKVTSDMRRTTRARRRVGCCNALLGSLWRLGRRRQRRQPGRPTVPERRRHGRRPGPRPARVRSRSRVPTEGGIVKLISFTPLETMDPSEAYYVHTSAILSGLVTRSLTQYVRRRRQGHPGPRPGDRPRHQQRGLHRVEVHDPRRHQVRGRHPGHRRGRQVRPRAHHGHRPPSRSRPGCVLPSTTTRAALTTRAPTPATVRSSTRSSVDGMTVTITMAKPFPDMPYWMRVPGQRPDPEG